MANKPGIRSLFNKNPPNSNENNKNSVHNKEASESDADSVVISYNSEEVEVENRTMANKCLKKAFTLT